MSQERVAWQDVYAIIPHQNGSGIEYEGIDFSSGSTGIEANKYGLLLDNRPDIFFPHPYTSVPSANNVPEDSGDSFHLGIVSPGFQFVFDATLQNLGLFFWLLFQGGVTEDTGPDYKKWYQAYTSSSPNVWASVLRKMAEGSVSDSLVAHGVVCKSITLTGREGSTIKCTADMLFRNVDNGFDAGSALLDFSENPPLLFQDFDLYLPYPTQKSMSSFQYTVTNNARAKHTANDSKLVDDYRLGMITHALDIVCPWSDGGNDWQDELVAGTASTIWLSTTNFLIRLTDSKLSEKVETISDGGVTSASMKWRGFDSYIEVTDQVDRLS